MAHSVAPAAEAVDLSSHAAVVRTIAELGSAARAARLLGVSLRSATASWRLLERAAGMRLLTREGTVLRATALGAEYLAGAGARVSACEPRPVLQVDICAWELRSLLLPTLPCFSACHPALQLQVHASTSTLSPWPASLAAAVRTGSTWLSRDDATTLATYPRVACVAPSYLEAYGPPGENTLAVDSTRGGWVADASGGPAAFAAIAGAESPIALSTADVDIALTAALAGRAVAVLPLSASVRTYLARRRLVRVLETLSFADLDVVLLRSPANPDLSEPFARWVRSLYESDELHARALLRRNATRP